MKCCVESRNFCTAESLPYVVSARNGVGKIGHKVKCLGTSSPQMMAQNFFLQIKTCSGIFSSFSNVRVVTSHRNFGARSLILERIVLSSLIMIKPWMSNKESVILNEFNLYHSIIFDLLSSWKTEENSTRQYLWMTINLACTLYSLRPILLFANTDVSTTKMCLDTSVLAKSNMGRREYYI
jgi:hypothetical protein